MACDKKELSEEMLDGVAGGLTYDTINKKLRANDNYVYYSYEDYDAVMAFHKANKDSTCSPVERDRKLIEGMLAAGLIKPIQ